MPGTCLKRAFWARFLVLARFSSRITLCGMRTRTVSPTRLNATFGSLKKCRRMPPILSSSVSSMLTTWTSCVTVLPAYLWLKSTVTRPELMNLITPFLSSISTVSPTTQRSASSPSLRVGSALTFFLFTGPNACSGGASMVKRSPAAASASRSAMPGGGGNDGSPIETSRSWRGAASFPEPPPRVVSNTSPVSFMDDE